MNPLNVLLVAEEAAGVQTLRLLDRSPHRLVAVLTSPARTGEPAVRGSSVRDVASGLGLPVWSARRVKDPALAASLQEAEVDLLLNVHSLYIIHPEVLAAPRLGAFNLHPGPLPDYAGMNAPSWALYHGERRHGVSLHWMEAGIDTGAIAYQASFDLTEQDTGLSVSSKCVRLGLPLIERLLETAAGNPGAVPRLDQDPGRRRYFGFEVPQGGRLDWGAPAARIVDFVRACDFYPLPSPWGYPQTCLDGARLAVMKALRSGRACSEPPGTIGEASDDAVAVAAADEWVMVKRVELDGRARAAKDVLRPGARLSAYPAG